MVETLHMIAITIMFQQWQLNTNFEKHFIQTPSAKAFKNLELQVCDLAEHDWLSEK